MTATRQGPASFMSLMLFGLAGFAGLFAVAVMIATTTGQGFQISANGVDGGVPLPQGWPYVGLFAALGVALYGASRSWDTPGFSAFRQRRPWVVPTVGVLVAFPAFVAVLFVLVS
ncbi:MAG: hypothetical protein AAF799_16470 [Myxococcota bacterium]